MSRMDVIIRARGGWFDGRGAEVNGMGWDESPSYLLRAVVS